MKSCHAHHIPAYPTDRHKDWPVSIRGGCYQNEYRTSALSVSVRSTSDFAGSAPARNTCFAPVAAHHDSMPLCFIIHRTWRPG